MFGQIKYGLVVAFEAGSHRGTKAKSKAKSKTKATAKAKGAQKPPVGDKAPAKQKSTGDGSSKRSSAGTADGEGAEDETGEVRGPTLWVRKFEMTRNQRLGTLLGSSTRAQSSRS